MNKLIKYYKSQYFNMIQILKDEGEEIEIGNDFKFVSLQVWKGERIKHRNTVN